MDDEPDIHDRLEQLEATVADQQQTIEQLSEQPAVGRRGVLASLLGAGAVGGLAGYGSQSARAASGPAGQVGTAEEPVDGFLWDLDVQGQVASDLPMGGNDVTGVGAVEAEVLNSDWVVDAGDHDSIQAAVNHASNEEIGLVVIPPGDYDESDIQVPRGMRLSGVSPDSGEPGFSGTSIQAEDDNNPLLDLDSRSITIQHLSLVADGAGSAVSISGSDCRMTGCNFRDGEISVTADGDRARIIDNTSNGQDIGISADNCVVIGNTRIGSVNDSGSGNEVANNT